jgi:hypothetical protein
VIGLEVLRILEVVLLVIFLCRIKRFSRQDFGHDRLIEAAGFREFLFRRFSDLSLLVVIVVDRGLVGEPDIVKLAVSLSWVDVVPENVEQLFVGNLRGIIADLDRFPLLCLVGVDKLIVRSLLGTAGITNHGFHIRPGLVEGWLHAPETASGENGLFCFRLHSLCSDGEAAKGQNEKNFMHGVPVRTL